MSDPISTAPDDARTVDARASAFVTARRTGSSLPAYPGALPRSLDEAYQIQAAAIELWPHELMGWKVGRIPAPADLVYGTDRLAGPIFGNQISHEAGAENHALVFEGGFGAIEGEIVIEVAQDAPIDKRTWSLDEARKFIRTMRLGVEVASSPLLEINDLGPLVTISDFGNNNGLIVGDAIADWRGQSPEDWAIRTTIDGKEVGAATAASIPGGPEESFRAVLEICAHRNMPLRRGMLVTTGAVTGIHSIRPGQLATIEMPGLRPIQCRADYARNRQFLFGLPQ